MPAAKRFTSARWPQVSPRKSGASSNIFCVRNDFRSTGCPAASSSAGPRKNLGVSAPELGEPHDDVTAHSRAHEEETQQLDGLQAPTEGITLQLQEFIQHFPVFFSHFLAPPSTGRPSTNTTLHSNSPQDLMPVNVAIQNSEANFRSALIRLRDQAEPLSLEGVPSDLLGEDHALGSAGALLERRFAEVKQAIWDSMQVGFRLQSFTSAYGLVAGVLPFLVLAPSFFR